VLLSVCLPLRYSVRAVVTLNETSGLRTRSLAARMSWALGAACAAEQANSNTAKTVFIVLSP
jgi:hypothetical protein